MNPRPGKGTTVTIITENGPYQICKNLRTDGPHFVMPAKCDPDVCKGVIALSRTHPIMDNLTLINPS